MNPPTEPIKHPFMNQTAQPGEIEQLAAMLDLVKSQQDALKITELMLRDAIGGLTKGEKKTEYVQSMNYEVKVEHPSGSFEQAALKRIWNNDKYDHPMLTDTYLRIGSIAVNKQQYSKLEKTSGNAEFEEFKKELLATYVPPKGSPAVKLKPKGGA